MKKAVILLIMLMTLTSYSQSLSVTEYKNSKVLNTNFTVPLVRFNFIDDTADELAKGNVTFFSSVGAGISYNLGRLYQTTDGNSKITDNEFNNIIGVQAGFLFSAKTGTTPTNIFALTAGINILDFHVGYGYELGTIEENQKRGFLTISYSIPVSKLTKAGLYIINKGEEVQADEKSTF
ncbi:hypothetical protein [Maribacter sp. MAR_2009_72]|uniref:hypothetical protein n=1 Tax=Maribacter sp. MAR_2009_72 TaxID=1250050 RepID=UPI00119A5351|nr:hypothetical protein [Maribacter sp. MAR_2009_72]TVZ14337.1 hypothetical protein JM81_0540 [Maribacter sp. MAR_2009_72]